MAMLFYITSVLACINYAASRDVGRMMRQGPTISNSLVNLGKMDISFYLGKPSDLPSRTPDFRNVLQSFKQPNPQRDMVGPCPCSQFGSKIDDMIPKSSEIINKILSSNALFRNPFSATCCDSHEQVHEDTFIIDLTSNDFPKAPMILPMLPEKPTIKPQVRPNAVEIFLFPKRKDLASMDFLKQSMGMFKKAVAKDEIKKVGKDVSSIQPLNEGTSVKKDLAFLEKTSETQKVEKPTATPANSL